MATPTPVHAEASGKFGRSRLWTGVGVPIFCSLGTGGWCPIFGAKFTGRTRDATGPTLPKLGRDRDCRLGSEYAVNRKLARTRETDARCSRSPKYSRFRSLVSHLRSGS